LQKRDNNKNEPTADSVSAAAFNSDLLSTASSSTMTHSSSSTSMMVMTTTMTNDNTKQYNVVQPHQELIFTTNNKVVKTSFENRTYYTFGERLVQLADYKRKNGNCKVPSSFKEYGNIGIWVKRQRQEYKNYKENKKGSMTKDRTLLLRTD
jgi:hypothetical protein